MEGGAVGRKAWWRAKDGGWRCGGRRRGWLLQVEGSTMAVASGERRRRPRCLRGRRDGPRSIRRVRIRNEAGENPNRLELDGPDYKLGGSDG